MNRTANNSVNKTAFRKSAIKKTPGIMKASTSILDKSGQFRANESLANRRKSIIETEMSRDQVIVQLDLIWP